MRSGAMLWVAAALAFPATAAQFYRCTDADGRVEYRDVPCAGRSGAAVNVRPNVVTTIDQSAARAASQAIDDRAAARRRDEQAARDRQAASARGVDGSTVGGVSTNDAMLPWWQVGGPPPDRIHGPGAGGQPPGTKPPPPPPPVNVAPRPQPLR